MKTTTTTTKQQEPELSTLERIRSWQEQIKKEVGNLEIELSKQLSKAAESYKLIKEIDPTIDVWADTQFSQSLNGLKLQPEGTTEKKASTVRFEVSDKIREEIIKVLTGQATRQDKKWIESEFLKSKVKCSTATLNLSLPRLVEDGTLTVEKDGVRNLYLLKQ
jgi:hypothetical protein